MQVRFYEPNKLATQSGRGNVMIGLSGRKRDGTRGTPNWVGFLRRHPQSGSSQVPDQGRGDGFRDPQGLGIHGPGRPPAPHPPAQLRHIFAPTASAEDAPGATPRKAAPVSWIEHPPSSGWLLVRIQQGAPFFLYINQRDNQPLANARHGPFRPSGNTGVTKVSQPASGRRRPLTASPSRTPWLPGALGDHCCWCVRRRRPGYERSGGWPGKSRRTSRCRSRSASR